MIAVAKKVLKCVEEYVTYLKKFSPNTINKQNYFGKPKNTLWTNKPLTLIFENIQRNVTINDVPFSP